MTKHARARQHGFANPDFSSRRYGPSRTPRFGPALPAKRPVPDPSYPASNRAHTGSWRPSRVRSIDFSLANYKIRDALVKKIRDVDNRTADDCAGLSLHHIIRLNQALTTRLDNDLFLTWQSQQPFADPSGLPQGDNSPQEKNSGENSNLSARREAVNSSG